MSKVGKQPVSIPRGVEVKVEAGNIVRVKGPKGELSLKVDPQIKVEVQDGVVRVQRPTDQKRHRALHGLYRALIANMVEGVTKGFRKELELIGVGYRASVNNNMLELALGYSHGVVFVPPPEIQLRVERQEERTVIVVEGIDKALVGQVAAKIRSLRKPDVYTGKGLRYVGEYVRRKLGKAALKK